MNSGHLVLPDFVLRHRATAPPNLLRNVYV